jgi:hypothetical protein
MSYKLFTDKVNKFQCTLQVEGTSLTKSQARVILETNDISYLFRGKINNEGLCEFELPRLKGILNEGSIGVLKLEVIADDVHFEPWSSDFVVEANKKVTVTLQEQTEEVKKPNISMSQITLTEVVEPEPIPVIKEEKAPIKEEKKVTDSLKINKNDLMSLLKKK